MGRHLADGYFHPRVSENIRQQTMQLLRADIVDLRDIVRTGIASHIEDDRVIAIAFQEEVDYFVTGDRQLLLRDGFEGLRIITPRAFVDILGAMTP